MFTSFLVFLSFFLVYVGVGVDVGVGVLYMCRQSYTTHAFRRLSFQMILSIANNSELQSTTKYTVYHI